MFLGTNGGMNYMDDMNKALCKDLENMRSNKTLKKIKNNFEKTAFKMCIVNFHTVLDKTSVHTTSE